MKLTPDDICTMKAIHDAARDAGQGRGTWANWRELGVAEGESPV